MIKILLADDHQMFIDGMKSFLKTEPNIEVVGQALNGEDILQELQRMAVDVIIMDVRMPNMDGIEATRRIKQLYPDVKVLVLSMFNEKSYISQLMELGASGYILKEKSYEELVMAINNVYAGKPHFGLEVLTTATTVSPEDTEHDISLTKREIEVLIKIAEGHTSEEIARLLIVQKTTIDTHRRNLLDKLGLKRSTQLVRYAIKKGYVNL